MPPAIIAAGVVAAGTIGGAAIASGSQKSAANQAAQAQQQATDSQLQLGRENIGFQQGIYDKNTALLNPFVQRGNEAGGAINSLLGLGGQQATPGAQTASPYTQQPLNAMSGNQWDAYLSANPDVAAESQRVTADHEFGSPEAYAQYHYQHFGQGEGRQLPQANAMIAPQASVAPVQTNPQTNTQSATDAFNNFANSAGMQFQQQQSANALNNLYAAHGQIQSGAAMKGISDRAQQVGLNNYFMPYLGLLQGQQATGAQSGSAIAGVGSNFGNTVSNIYGGQQNAIGNAADATSNAALLRGQANAGFGNSIGSALGTLGSSFVNNNPFASGGSGYNAFNSGYSMPVTLPTAQPLGSLPGAFRGY